MRLHATLSAVKEPGHVQRGLVIHEELDRRGWAGRRKEFAVEAKISREMLSRAENGHEMASNTTLRLIEGALHLPRYFLTYVERGDTARVEACEMDPDIKRWVLDLMREDDGPGAQRMRRHAAN